MFVVSFLIFLYGFLAFLLILLVLVQKGKGSFGLGNIGGFNQKMFGGSGGQTVFQKLTWIFCFLLLFGSLSLAYLKGKYTSSKVALYKKPV